MHLPCRPLLPDHPRDPGAPDALWPAACGRRAAPPVYTRHHTSHPHLQPTA